jgi:radical SAM superfamily enzyme YgiQ (UPF0313 family)
MRILLVESGVTAPERFVYQCYPPHGLMYLASYLRSKSGGHQLRIYDMMAERAGPKDIDRVIREFSPELVAIHAMSFQASCMRRIAARIKEWNPECTVAVGGPHPSANPELTLGDPHLDLAAVGEGEETFVEIVDRLKDGGDPAGIPGTVVRRNGEIIRGPERGFIEDLDRIPFPAWDLVDLRKYFTDVMLTQNDITDRKEVTTVFTSRACPFRCVYCHSMFGKKFRARSVDSVLDEMEALQRDYGIRELHVIDDCFNLKTGRALEIMMGIKDRGLDFKLAFPTTSSSHFPTASGETAFPTTFCPPWSRPAFTRSTSASRADRRGFRNRSGRACPWTPSWTGSAGPRAAAFSPTASS